jgi:uncharacterized membrane protein
MMICMYRQGFGPGYIMGHDGGGPHVLGIIFVVVLLVAIATLVVLAVRWTRHGPPAPAPAGAQLGQSDAALAAARMRYARGELSREDFLRISTDLQEPPPGSPPGS